MLSGRYTTGDSEPRRRHGGPSVRASVRHASLFLMLGSDRSGRSRYLGILGTRSDDVC